MVCLTACGKHTTILYCAFCGMLRYDVIWPHLPVEVEAAKPGAHLLVRVEVVEVEAEKPGQIRWHVL